MNVGPFQIGPNKLTLLGGPCLAESLDMCLQVAESLKTTCEKLGVNYIFKASFDKANRTSAGAGRGAGMEAGLGILAAVKETLGISATTDVHLPEQAAPVAEVADLLQVPAFLCRQSDLLEACAKSGRPVNVKKGQFLSPWDTQYIVKKLQAFGANGIMLTERGTTFGYNTLVVDMPGLEVMRSFGVPVCFDATHSAQRPGAAQGASGGNRDSIPAMARAAAAVGIDALFMEVHPDPANALSDKETQWPLADAERLLAEVHRIWQARRELS
ncbi:MAG: 3-deoxy-8-phosphooctulonate synthase [Armatimonadetes bacterium]|nr:3-deoxy-8-phosphooctulonate synthase [Armatimonadota bacterium]